MATKTGDYINIPVITLGTKTATSATYTCRCSFKGYYGHGSPNEIGIIDHTGACVKYVGWYSGSNPTAPNSSLRNGSSVNWSYGQANGYMIPNSSNRIYEFTRTVQIDRGTSRKGSIRLTAGVKSKSGYNHFYLANANDRMVPFILETTEIPLPEFTTELTYTVDSPQTSGNRYINLSISFTNPIDEVSNTTYYTAKLYYGDTLLTTSDGTSLTYSERITESMFNTTRSYRCVLVGRDNNNYGEKSCTTSEIQPDSPSIVIKTEDGLKNVTQCYFKNGRYITPVREIWVKKNGQIYKVGR